MKLTCDECQKEYELTSLNTNLKEDLPNNVERYYIQCPNCNAQYTSHYLNDELKAIQFEMAKINQRKQPLKIKQKNRLARLKRQLLEAHGRLKTEVEKRLS